jgi:glucose-6-phosphate 1-dehydrogenase
VPARLTATSTSTASPSDSTTETYAALRLEIDNWRWSGVPFFIHRQVVPGHPDRGRLVFRRAPRLGFAMITGTKPNQLVIKLDPSTGVRFILDAHRADAEGAEPVTLDRFSKEGGVRPPPQCCCMPR